MPVVNAYTVRPCDIKSGDAMLFVVKALVVRPGVYRLYRCQYEGKVPEGHRLSYGERVVCEELFPSLASVAKPDDWYN